MKKLFSPKILIILVLLLMLLLGAFINGQGASKLPTLSEQEHVARYESEDNGYLLFMEAYDLLTSTATSLEDELSKLYEEDEVSDALRSALDSNIPALDKVREGLAKPYSIAPYINVQSQATKMNTLSYTRELGRQLAYRAAVDRLDGNPEAALKGYLDIVRLGERSGQGGVLILGLVSVAIQDLATREALEELLPDLSVEQLNHLIGILEAEEKKLISFEQILANERSAMVVGFSGKIQYLMAKKVLEPAFDRANESFKLRDAEIRRVLLKARVERYTREHGEAPVTLEDVMDGAPVPIDPYTGAVFEFIDGQPYSADLEDVINKRKKSRNN